MNMKVTKLKPSQLIPNPDNPRIIKDDNFHKLVKSIKEFPDMANIRPVVVNAENMILGGNMRYRAMIEAGWDEIPVIVVDLPPDKQKEFIIKDNVSGGEWDWDKLANEWDEKLLDKWGIDTTEWNKENESEKDFDYKEDFQVVIKCSSEQEQEAIYNKAKELGWKVEILTL